MRTKRTSGLEEATVFPMNRRHPTDKTLPDQELNPQEWADFFARVSKVVQEAVEREQREAYRRINPSEGKTFVPEAEDP